MARPLQLALSIFIGELDIAAFVNLIDNCGDPGLNLPPLLPAKNGIRASVDSGDANFSALAVPLSRMKNLGALAHLRACRWRHEQRVAHSLTTNTADPTSSRSSKCRGSRAGPSCASNTVCHPVSQGALLLERLAVIGCGNASGHTWAHTQRSIAKPDFSGRRERVEARLRALDAPSVVRGDTYLQWFAHGCGNPSRCRLMPKLVEQRASLLSARKNSTPSTARECFELRECRADLPQHWLDLTARAGGRVFGNFHGACRPAKITTSALRRELPSRRILSLSWLGRSTIGQPSQDCPALTKSLPFRH